MCENCPPGFYCTGASSDKTICPVQSICPGEKNSVPTECSTGFYSNEQGSIACTLKGCQTGTSGIAPNCSTCDVVGYSGSSSWSVTSASWSKCNVAACSVGAAGPGPNCANCNVALYSGISNWISSSKEWTPCTYTTCITDIVGTACRKLPVQVNANATTNLNYSSGVGSTVSNPTTQVGHVVDGLFTGWAPGMVGNYEWSGITPARGRFTNAYFDFDGTYLHILNDWIYNDQKPVTGSCYNLFHA